MSEARNCPVCGAPLPADARTGRCPRCLLKLGFEGGRSTEGVAEPQGDIPESIGPYRLLQKLGEGGMGEVWLAEQSEPFKRRVSVKVIKHGMDSKQFVARFEAERQALALMDHSAVAKVFDAGTTSRGRPYFVMEYVPGVPITEHCDRHKLPIRERLELFIRVCEGVQHAHQKAVIHRDLKPSNVLVSIENGRAFPKIIDFGVAKATAQKLTDRTMFTELGVLIGTPEYMSPEQAEGTAQDVDTRADVYSLGVMLYELLVGALPFDSESLRQAGVAEIVRTIREVEPSRPSTRVSTLGGRASEPARMRRTDVRALQRQLRGDLDWITMKALEKDRTRRYGSPQELAADIGRYLACEPVQAGPPGRVYLVSKFVRRHRVGVGFAAMLLVVLVGFAAAMATQANRIAAERDRASEEATTARQVSEFLVDLFSVSDPWRAQDETITAREILDAGTERIERELRDQPLVRARLMSTMGQVYASLGLYDEGEHLIHEAYVLRRAELGEWHPATAATLANLGNLKQRCGKYEDGKDLLELALEIQERELGADHPDTARTKYYLGTLLAQTGERSAGLALLERVLPVLQDGLGASDRLVSDCLNDLGAVHFDMGEYALAKSYFERNLELLRERHGSNHPQVAMQLNNIGYVLAVAGSFDEAKDFIEQALTVDESVFEPDHPVRASHLHSLGELYRRTGDLDKAAACLSEGLAIQERVLGPEHRELAETLSSLGRVRSESGAFVEAARLFDRALAIQEKVLDPTHPLFVETLEAYAAVLRELGRDREAGAVELRVRSIRGRDAAD